MRALVTGGGGFLGRNLVTALLDRGDDVRILARGSYPELADAGADTTRGDIADAATVAHAVRGCDVVFHVAAKVGAAGSAEAFERANVRGTQNVIDACRSEGVRHLVFTSTPSVVFGHGDLEGVDESHPYPVHYDAHYPRTKAHAERLVLEAAGEDLRTVALRPHIVWGPGDTSLLPRLLARADKLRRIESEGPPKKMDVTYIDDAVAAHLAAADRLLADSPPISGNAYFISSGAPVEIWTFIDQVLGAAGRPPIKKKVSKRAALAVGWVSETVHRLFGREGEPRLSRWIVRELTTSHWFDTTAAQRDLGLGPGTPLPRGLAALRAEFKVRDSVSNHA